MINWTQSALALAEGFGLAFSPCILPILPLILASSASGSKVRPLQIIAGFIVSFTLFSLVSRQILAATGIQQDQIQMGAYALLLLFGLVMLIPWLESKFASGTGPLADWAQKINSNEIMDKRGGGFLVGALIGIVWIPCAGPILAIAVLQVIQSQTNLDAMATIAAFSIGAAIPMLFIAYAGQSLIKHVQALSKHAVAIRRAMGVVIIIFAGMGLSGFNLGVWAVTQGFAAEPFEQQETRLKDGLSRPYKAPDFEGIAYWINSPALTMADLKDKVVLIDFWTYSCINCIRTLPYLKSWYEKYKDDGFVIVGVHSPEFAFEGEVRNVKKAVKKFGITYPVALDNSFDTWRNYENRYWPAHYLISREGKVVYTHFGEGQYDVTENNIRHLLGLDHRDDLEEGDKPYSFGQTPETYLGTARADNEIRYDKDAGSLPLHHWFVTGNWLRTREHIESREAGAALTMHFRSRKVFLVMESADDYPKTVKISYKGWERQLTVQDSELYELIDAGQVTADTVRIEAQDPGLRMFAFTFGK